MATHRIRNHEVESGPTGLLVLLDTSFLLTSLKQRLDYESALERLLGRRLRIATIDRVLYELQHLARVAPWTTSRLARVALELVTRGKIEIIDTDLAVPDTDTSLLEFALESKNPVAIATVDSKLRDLSKRHGLTVISPRSRFELAAAPGTRFHLP